MAISGLPITDTNMAMTLIEVGLYKNTSLGWLDIKDMPHGKVFLIHQAIIEMQKEEQRQIDKANRKNRIRK
mgnify:CR=1 FL=1